MNAASRIPDIEAGGLDSAPIQDRELQQLRNVYFALRRAMFWIIGFAAFAGAAAFVVAAAADKKFTATAQVMIDTRIVSNPEFTPHVSGLPTNIVSLESELEVLRSTDLIERIVKRLDLQSHPELRAQVSKEKESDQGLRAQIVERLSAVAEMLFGAIDSPGPALLDPEVLAIEDTIKAIEDARTIQQVGTTSAVYAVRMVTGDPALSAQLANAIATEYLSSQTEAKVQSLERSQGWLSTRIDRMREDLDTLSHELETHSIEAPFSSEEYATIKAKRTTAQRKLREIEEEIAVLLARRAEIVEDLSGDEQRGAERSVAAVDAGGDSGLLEDLVGTGASSALPSEVSDIDALIQNLRQRQAALTEESELLREAQALQSQHDAKSRRISYEISVAEAIYQDFVSQLSRRTQQDEYLNADARIIENARPATAPSAPRKKLVAVISAIVAALLATAFVIISELSQSRMRTLREFEETAGLPLFAFFRQVRGGFKAQDVLVKNKLPRQLENSARKLMLGLDADANAKKPLKLTVPIDHGPHGKSAQHEMQQATSLPKPHAAGDVRMIAGAAVAPKTGLSSTLLSLAVAYARAGQRVLYIEGNAGRSQFTSYLRKRKINQEFPRDIGTLIRTNQVATGVPGLTLFPYVECKKGAESVSTEYLFVKQEGRSALDELSRDFDVVIIDTPPLLRDSRAFQYLLAADQIFLCLRWNSTTRAECSEALRTLDDLKLRPTCIVSTRTHLRRAKLYGDQALIVARSSA